ncbi:LON peptidase N-terminal domain and RING finger protein 2 [Aplochiton taeniatus]
METRIQPHQGELFLHPLSNPGAAGIYPEMLEVAEEASWAGDYNLAVEIYSSQLADLQQPDRGLCLRKADSLVLAGRITEALDSYCTAAKLGKPRGEELGLLVENIARTLREKDLNITSRGRSDHTKTQSGLKNDEDVFEDEPLDLFLCRLCRCLLSEPTTLECGHTFCKSCIEDDTVKDCIQCRHKLSRNEAIILPIGLRVNVVLSSLLDKWFDSESKARRYWIEGEVQWKKRDLADALDKYNKAVELAPSANRLVHQRAELHLEMGNYRQAVHDAEIICCIKPFSPEAHYVKASALSQSGRNEEAFQEYLMCLALKPDWPKAKLEAQKVLSDLFSSVFDSGDTPLHPLQGGPPSRLFKPAALLSSLRPLGLRNSSASCDSGQFSVTKTLPWEGPSGSSRPPLSPGRADPSPEEGGSKSLASVLAALPAPSGGLKRKHSGEGQAFDLPAKFLKQDDVCYSRAPPAAAAGTAAECGGRTVPVDLLDSGDMECSLCMRLFYEPVATPCGHTFCLKCLERCMDHNPNCPLCKENLSKYLAVRGFRKTLLMEEVLQRYLGKELAERKKMHEEEMKELSNLNQEVPIFICTMAFPTIPCPLHVFEPRYRLMIRRSIETGTKQFGMCIADELKGFADHGCMLEVRDVKFFPDGRSVVDTIGAVRFKVLSHGLRDGYNTAKIEYLEDKEVEGDELVELQKLHDSVYEQASGWFTSLKENMKSQILSHFGSLPGKDSDPQFSPSGPAWCWWLLAVLPLENRAQLTILAMTSLKDRLIAIRRVLIFVTRKRPR